MMLIDLPPDVAAAVAAMLEPEELELLADVCHATADSSIFNPPKRQTLTLPPNNRDRARRLLTALHSRLSRFDRIDIAQPSHIGLMADCGVSSDVTSVRVRTQSELSAAVKTFCAKLGALPNLTKLDLSDTVIRDVSVVAQLTQLRSLDISRTRVTDTAPLAPLIQLEELACRVTWVVDMTCIENMTNLRRLDVVRRCDKVVMLPSMRRLTKLQSLTVGMVSILSVADFIGACSQLKHLSLDAILSRHLDDGTLASSADLARVDMHSLLHLLPQLEVIAVGSSRVSAMPLSQLPKLRRIGRSVASDFEFLVALRELREMGVFVGKTTSPADYRVLLELPKLKKLSIDKEYCYTREVAKAQLQSCLDVVGEMAQLESLHFVRRIAFDTFAPHFQRFGRLRTLSMEIDARTKTLDGLEACRSLRSLTIEVFHDAIDLSAIGLLTQLEELSFKNANHDARAPHQVYAFVANLVNLKTLSLSGKIKDLSTLLTLTQLEKLTIASTSHHPMTNYDSLGQLKRLRELDIRETTITDVTPLAGLPFLKAVVLVPYSYGPMDLRPLAHLQFLRSVYIPRTADSRVLTDHDPPRLLRVDHPKIKCAWRPPFSSQSQSHP